LNIFDLRISRRIITYLPEMLCCDPLIGIQSVQGLGLRIKGLGLRVYGLGFRVSGFGFRAQGSGFRVQGSGFRV